MKNTGDGKCGDKDKRHRSHMLTSLKIAAQNKINNKVEVVYGILQVKQPLKGQDEASWEHTVVRL